VLDHIGDRLPYAFADLGEQSVKNIARPVRVYALRSGAVRDRPRSAILGSLPISGDRCDGLDVGITQRQPLAGDLTPSGRAARNALSRLNSVTVADTRPFKRFSACRFKSFVVPLFDEARRQPHCRPRHRCCGTRGLADRGVGAGGWLLGCWSPGAHRVVDGAEPESATFLVFGNNSIQLGVQPGLRFLLPRNLSNCRPVASG